MQYPIVSNSSASILTEKRPIFSKITLDEDEKDKCITIKFYFGVRGNLPCEKKLDKTC